MKQTTRFPRLLLAGAAALALAIPTLRAQPALADRVEPPTVPAAIQVPAGNEAYLVGHAVGTQNYTCLSTAVWSSAVPQATLFNDRGKQIATHFAGPTWQANDGSSVVGTKVAGVTVDPTAIPWLLLSAVSTSAGPDEGDRLVGTTYIQRLNTAGGLAPATPCTPGATASVPYTADYYFYRAAEDDSEDD